MYSLSHTSYLTSDVEKNPNFFSKTKTWLRDQSFDRTTFLRKLFLLKMVIPLKSLFFPNTFKLLDVPSKLGLASEMFWDERTDLLGLVSLLQFRLGQVMLGQVRLGQVRLGQVRLVQVRLGQVRLGQVRLGQVRLGQVRLGQVRLVKHNPSRTSQLSVVVEQKLFDLNCRTKSSRTYHLSPNVLISFPFYYFNTFSNPSLLHSSKR